MLDANVAWHAVISMVGRATFVYAIYEVLTFVLCKVLKLIPSSLQEEFIAASDVPWRTPEEASVRVVGSGAVNMTLVLIKEAGHFVSTLQHTSFVQY